METQTSQSQSKTCPLCNLEFSCVSAKNRHLKKIHNHQIDTNAKKSHIICPLCTENKLVCGTYSKLEKHLEVNHKIKIEMRTYNFATRESYELWFDQQKIETTYASARSKRSNDYLEKSYTCNRSNSIGHGSNCSKRTEKAGGSIKMYGVCPSHLNIKLWQTGEITVKFWKSHVGHEEEIRSQHLSKLEKTEIVTKLCSGVTIDRIMSDARKLKSEKIQRINMLNRNDVSYLMKKHNVMKKKHENSMIARHRLGSKTVLGDVAELLSEEKSSEIEKGHNEENKNFVREKTSESHDLSTIDGNVKREAEIKTLTNFLRSLNDDDYKKCMGQFNVIMEKVNRSVVHKRKKDKQEFFPTKRKK